MKSTEVRRLRKEFRETKAPADRKHAWAQPASLIVNSAEDPTTLFNTAGMQPLVPYLMGKPHPTGSKRVYNIQGCVRTVDIDEVGDERHLTFFEMMGNRSLGDYFKKESIAWSREFLTEWMQLDPKKIAVTVFEGDADAPRDEESAELRKEQGVLGHKISYLGKKDNRWGPAGKTGPCGPDTEIFYWIGPSEFPPEDSNVANDEDNWLEIWNNVFMAYYKDEKGIFSELAAKNVDTGMGFERITMVTQCAAGEIEVPIKQASVYDTDIFHEIINRISVHIQDSKRKRIIADHLRTSFWLIQEGLIPSNEARGYVLRRLIRRLYFQRYMGTKDSVGDATMQAFEWLLYEVKEILNQIYDGIFTNSVITTIVQETQQFSRTIRAGEQMVAQLIEQGGTSKCLSGEQVFKLYDTYGFPVELTKEIAAEHDWQIDEGGYQKALEAAQEQSRRGTKEMFAKNTDWASHIEGIPQTEFLGYTMLDTGDLDVTLLKDFEVDGQRVLIFNRSPFYAEGGGQKGDTGVIKLEGGEQVQVIDVQKYGGVRLHFVR